MSLNIFEGARRIALLTAAIWAIGVAIVVWNTEERVAFTYLVSWPMSFPVRIEGNACKDDDATDWKYTATVNGTPLSITVCFRSQKARDGNQVIPFRVDAKGQWWGGARYSTEVSDYIRIATRDLPIATDDERWADSQIWNLRLKKAKALFQWIGGGWFFLWMFTLAVGWIVRGFFGIPRDRDKKPDHNLSTNR